MIAAITLPTLYLIETYLPVDRPTNRYIRGAIGILACIATLYLLIRFLRATHHPRHALRENLCPTCSYDLCAHTPGQRCPECGTPIRARTPAIISKSEAKGSTNETGYYP
jgi:hypothetical protein